MPRAQSCCPRTNPHERRRPYERAIRSGDVSVHRHRGVDAAVGDRRRGDACGTGSPRRALREAIASRRVGSSNTPATGYARHSRRPALPSTLQLPRSEHWSCRFGWASRRAKPNCATTTTSAPALNRAARVMACGHGGQILIDGATAGLLTGVDLLDLGPRRLRDIAKPVYMFQVRAAGVADRFPAPEDTRPDAGKPTRRTPQVSSDANPNSPN